ncbi:ROK family protein [Halomonas sp. V046]|uniref:ROK family protein n=1 Tax=Halomonas sp. V046 TaxID=3459611 RepID=UPI0040441C3A
MTSVPRQPAGDLGFLKQLNRNAVLETLRRTPGLTRAEIAQQASLTKVTVGAGVQALLDDGWLKEGEPVRRGGGRPGRALFLNEARHALIGVEIGVHGLHAMACTLGGERLTERHEALAPTTPEATIDRLASLLEEMLMAPVMQGRELLGLGLAVPGPTSPGRRRLSLAPTLGWRDVALLDMLRSRLPRLGGHWLMDNEAKAAAFGELYFRAEPGPAPGSLLYVSAGSGIGSGLVENGTPLRVIRGVHGLAGEVGHTVLQPGGLYCHCGNRGCAETLVSGWSIRAALGIDEHLTLEQAVTDHPDQDRVAVTLKHAGDALGMMLLNLHHTLNPAEIVIGGSLTRLGPALLEPALALFEEQQNRLLPEASRIVPRILDDSRLVAARGAAAEVLSWVLSELPVTAAHDRL